MKKEILLKGKHGQIHITRLAKGVPHIKAEHTEDAFWGLGYMHGYDRGFQMWFTKILAEGRLAEHFGDSEELVEIDKYFRRLRFSHPVGEELERLTPETRQVLNTYIDGVNYFYRNGKKPLEFRLSGVEWEPWRLNDSLAILRIMAYVGLAEAQGSEEKVLTEIILHGKEYFERLSRLFYPLFEGYDYAWFEGVKLTKPLGEMLPFNSGVGGSNNWAVSGKITKSGKPIYCNDPHLEVSRLPSIWYEVAIDTQQLWSMGITVPGTPGFASGWNGKVSWGMTFSCADTEDFFIEKCRNGQYLKDNTWYPFKKRSEIIKTKKGRKIEYILYENEHGILEGDPYVEGAYLARKWSGYEPVAGDSFNGFIEFMFSKDVATSMKIAKKMTIPTLNWVFADSEGNIGYRMTGGVPKRKKGLSGLLPLPGWDADFDWDGYVSPEKLPFSYNPEEGYIVTANDRLDQKCEVRVQTLPFPPYRSERIKTLLKENIPLDIKKMKDIQLDVYSLQAEKVINMFADYLKGDVIGEKLLQWNKEFNNESIEASIFKEFYDSLFLEVCSGRIIPEVIIGQVYYKSFLVQLIYNLIEDEWMREDGLFSDVDWESVIKKILGNLSGRKFKKWGEKNSILMKHILLGKTLIGKFGFNSGPFPFRGCESTVSQGTKYSSGDQDMTFGPSYRMIVDFDYKRVYSNIPGGSSGRPFTRYYKAEIMDWLVGNYKVIDR